MTITQICDVMILMPQSLALVLVHIIFSTKNRKPSLRSVELRSQVHAYLTGALRCLECDLFLAGGVEDHVHILCKLSRKISLSELVKNLKTSSTKLVKENGQHDFGWQSGYGVFSVSQSAKETVFTYIANQEMHHRKMNFQDEFRALLIKHEVRFDERYVWD
jgi:putative transposase